ncbi:MULTISPECIES: DUF72 domain-containing protein [unclassified Micromonospora]|uniref:DUF72 domain-containing protein n=1 Tax=unclassified Micromonospora TaxID=2617518 RepID=UPI001C2156DB|nr:MULTISPECIES: DUF72 domain-containing protein [unclassified Micromonospora]MBU8860685.1 DUF72 domain-containing protein [Micromonospora sp. WMMB482]MDM4780224.1 DUF72 domain-containing protein [Micromonospora sp. b486]
MFLVGTSGWQYRDWRERFYPAGLPQRRWLEHFAARFATVEVNNAFYRLPERDTFSAWRERTPGDFCVAVKMSRYLTHVKRLRDPAEPVARFLDRASGLGDRLGPVLVQLPPTLRADPDALAGVLRRFPAGVRVAVEPRHRSWWTDDTRRVLERHRAALVWADRLSRPVTPLWRTTDFGYLRLHEGRARQWPRYGRAALAGWVRRLAEAFGDGEPAYVYFNNDPGGAAIADAVAFAGLARRAGRPVSRTPAARPAEGAGRAGPVPDQGII